MPSAIWMRSSRSPPSRHRRQALAWIATALSLGDQAALQKDKNPLGGVTVPPSMRRVGEKPTIYESDLDRLVESCDTPHRKLAVAMAICADLDCGVIRRLTSKKFDFQRQAIRTRRDKTDAMLTIPIPDSIGSRFAGSVRQSTSVAPAALRDRPSG